MFCPGSLSSSLLYAFGSLELRQADSLDLLFLLEQTGSPATGLFTWSLYVSVCERHVLTGQFCVFSADFSPWGHGQEGDVCILCCEHQKQRAC